MPWLTKKNGEKTCVYKKGADGQPEGDPLHCYDGDDQEEKAKEYMKALYANADQSMSMTNFLFVELSQKDDLKKIDGLAASVNAVWEMMETRLDNTGEVGLFFV